MRHTKRAARFVLALRSEILIKAAARFTGLHWETVKNIEKGWLEKKYKKIRLDEVEYLGIDEVYLGKVMGYINLTEYALGGDPNIDDAATILPTYEITDVAGGSNITWTTSTPAASMPLRWG